MENYIKKYRERLGISQDRLAKIVDIRRETLSRFETNKGAPTLKTALKIAYVLDVDVSTLWRMDTEREIKDKLVFKGRKPFEIVGKESEGDYYVGNDGATISAHGNNVSYRSGWSSSGNISGWDGEGLASTAGYKTIKGGSNE